MMLLIFALLLVATLLAWIGQRRMALYLFFPTMALSILVFLHHVTSHLTLQL